MLSKEECVKALKTIEEDTNEIEDYNSIPRGYCNQFYEEIDLLKQLIKEHFDLLEEYKKLEKSDESKEQCTIEQYALIHELRDEIKELKSNPPKIDGNTSDGYHTFNELYHHRAVLFSIICNQNKEIAWKSKKHSDGSMYDGMFIVGINTPQGQYSYHYDIVPYWDLFKVKEFEKAPQWDGHEPKDIDRLLSIESNPPLKFEELKEGMWVWNNEWHEYLEIAWIECKKRGFCVYDRSDGDYLFHEFKDGILFRKQVKE